jgi:hypothetical protein
MFHGFISIPVVPEKLATPVIIFYSGGALLVYRRQRIHIAGNLPIAAKLG